MTHLTGAPVGQITAAPVRHRIWAPFKLFVRGDSRRSSIDFLRSSIAAASIGAARLRSSVAAASTGAACLVFSIAPSSNAHIGLERPKAAYPKVVHRHCYKRVDKGATLQFKKGA